MKEFALGRALPQTPIEATCGSDLQIVTCGAAKGRFTAATTSGDAKRCFASESQRAALRTKR